MHLLPRFSLMALFGVGVFPVALGNKGNSQQGSMVFQGFTSFSYLVGDSKPHSLFLPSLSFPSLAWRDGFNFQFNCYLGRLFIFQILD